MIPDGLINKVEVDIETLITDIHQSSKDMIQITRREKKILQERGEYSQFLKDGVEYQGLLQYSLWSKIDVLNELKNYQKGENIQAK